MVEAEISGSDNRMREEEERRGEGKDADGRAQTVQSSSPTGGPPFEYFGTGTDSSMESVP